MDKEQQPFIQLGRIFLRRSEIVAVYPTSGEDQKNSFVVSLIGNERIIFHLADGKELTDVLTLDDLNVLRSDTLSPKIQENPFLTDEMREKVKNLPAWATREDFETAVGKAVRSQLKENVFLRRQAVECVIDALKFKDSHLVAALEKALASQNSESSGSSVL